MKIIKLAQDGGIPAGWVEIEFDIGEQDQKVEIVGHGPGTSCGTQDDDALLRDLMDAEVGGFGPSTTDESGLTSEGYRERQKSKPKAINPLTQKPRTFGPAKTEEPEQRQYDQDYGV